MERLSSSLYRLTPNLKKWYVDVELPDWRLPGIKHRLRVTMHGNIKLVRAAKDGKPSVYHRVLRLSVARPGLNGNFDLSYRFQFNMDAATAGPQAILQRVENAQGMRSFRESEQMAHLTAQAIDDARLLLLGAV